MRWTAAVLAIAATPAVVRAQTQDEFSIERFRLALDRQGLFDVEWAGIPEHGAWDLGLWVSASHDPLPLDAAGSRVNQRIGGDLVASIALWRRLQLGLDLPVVLAQDDDLALDESQLDSFGVGDIRFSAKFGALGEPVPIAWVASVTAPTGNTDGFIGESAVTFCPELAISGAYRGLRLSANLGYRLRERRQLLDLVVDDELLARAGAGYRFSRVGGPPIELAGTLSAAAAASEPSASERRYGEFLFGVSAGFGGTLVGFAALGAGLFGSLGTPDWRAVAGIRIGIIDDS